MVDEDVALLQGWPKLTYWALQPFRMMPCIASGVTQCIMLISLCQCKIYHWLCFLLPKMHMFKYVSRTDSYVALSWLKWQISFCNYLQQLCPNVLYVTKKPHITLPDVSNLNFSSWILCFWHRLDSSQILIKLWSLYMKGFMSITTINSLLLNNVHFENIISFCSNSF